MPRNAAAPTSRSTFALKRQRGNAECTHFLVSFILAGQPKSHTFVLKEAPSQHAHGTGGLSLYLAAAYIAAF